MLTIIHGSDSFLVSSQLNDHLKQYNPEQIVFIDDLENFTHHTTQISLFSDTMVFVAREITCFETIDEFKKVQQKLQEINNDPDLVVILTTLNISRANKINDFCNQCKMISTISLSPDLLFDYISSWLNNHKIYLEPKLINLLAEKLPCQGRIIEHELNKLLFFDSYDEQIIIHLIADYREQNVFLLLKHILDNDFVLAINLFEKLCQSYDLGVLLQIMAGQLSKIILQAEMMRRNFDTLKITNSLKINNFVYKNNALFYKKLGTQKLNSIMDALFDLDFDFKLGRCDKYIGFKIFLIKLNIGDIHVKKTNSWN